MLDLRLEREAIANCGHLIRMVEDDIHIFDSLVEDGARKDCELSMNRNSAPRIVENTAPVAAPFVDRADEVVGNAPSNVSWVNAEEITVMSPKVATKTCRSACADLDVVGSFIATLVREVHFELGATVLSNLLLMEDAPAVDDTKEVESVMDTAPDRGELPCSTGCIAPSNALVIEIDVVSVQACKSNIVITIDLIEEEVEDDGTARRRRSEELDIQLVASVLEAAAARHTPDER